MKRRRGMIILVRLFGLYKLRFQCRRMILFGYVRHDKCSQNTGIDLKIYIVISKDEIWSGSVTKVIMENLPHPTSQESKNMVQWCQQCYDGIPSI